MSRRILPFSLLAAVCAVTMVSAFTNVTFIMKNGQRQQGEFVYHHDTNYNLMINGQERVFPSDDIAVIAFVAGDPPANEIAALSQASVPAEHDRHMLAFRDGRTLRGKIYDFQGDNIIIDAPERQTFPMSSVARLYVSAPAARAMFPAQQQMAAGRVQAQPMLPAPQPQQQGGIMERVDARGWTDTTLDVKRGDRLSFSTSDKIMIDARISTGAEGTGSAGIQDLPVKTLPVGALIGRIGRNGTPFGIGGNTQPLSMPENGRLFLGINDNKLNDNSGAFNVRVVR